MPLFRLENISTSDANRRNYNSIFFKPFAISKKAIDRYIATRIREQINGAKNRKLLSYSKSLAVCLLKYNAYVDNELHIYKNEHIDRIYYISKKGNEKEKPYAIEDRLQKTTPFKKRGRVDLTNFIIDVSNNEIVNKYLIKYTDTGLKVYSSPQKDCEVVVMAPSNDLCIKEFMPAVYLLYALQLRYNFLNYPNAKNELIDKIKELDCLNGTEEREPLIFIIKYLSAYWEYESKISQEMYRYISKKEHLSLFYDSILEFCTIQEKTFSDAWKDSANTPDLVRTLIWESCEQTLGSISNVSKIEHL